MNSNVGWNCTTSRYVAESFKNLLSLYIDVNFLHSVVKAWF